MNALTNRHETHDDNRNVAGLRASRHAMLRLQQRAIRRETLEFVLSEADQERHVGGGCRSYWISRRELNRLRCAGRDRALLERSAKVVVVMNPVDGVVVTAMPGYRRSARVAR
jgi:hypothetical protein